MGSAQLLMSQKVQQFYRLCQQNMVSARPPAWGRLRLSLLGWGAAEPMLCGMTWPLLSPQDPNAFPVPTFQDLAGFWDLLQLSIEDVSMKFAELQQLKANGWKIIEPKVRAGGHGAGAGARPSLLLPPTHLWPNRCCRRQKAPAGAFSNHLKNKEQEKKTRPFLVAVMLQPASGQHCLQRAGHDPTHVHAAGAQPRGDVGRDTRPRLTSPSRAGGDKGDKKPSPRPP